MLVEHRHSREGFGIGCPLGNHRLSEHSGDPGRCRSRTEEQKALVPKATPGQSKSSKHSRKRHCGRALEIIIEPAHSIAVAPKQPDAVDPGPILKLDATTGEDLF